MNKDYKKVLNIYNKLPKEQQLYVAPSGKFVDSPHLLDRYILERQKGFIEAYKTANPSEAFITLAVAPEFRGKGLGKKLINESLSRLKNIHVSAKEEAGKVVFLHKVKDGPVDKSYGINVAALAKLPKSLIARSKDILEQLETNDHAHKMDLTLFNFDIEPEEEVKVEKHEVIEELEAIDVNNLTPIEALNLLVKLKGKIND
jgi:GNAT superfamily N-acetyltransferase